MNLFVYRLGKSGISYVVWTREGEVIESWSISLDALLNKRALKIWEFLTKEEVDT
jgi:hypothetical protein